MSSTQPYVLKIYPRDDDYFREVYFLKRLATSFPVPSIVQLVEPSAEAKGAVLMEYIEGALLSFTHWTDALAYEVGSFLARIHSNRTSGYGDLTKPHSLSHHPEPHFRHKFEEELNECQTKLPKELMKKCSTYYKNHCHLLSGVDGPCMIHRDFRPGNILVSHDRVQGIIDWTGSCSGFAEQDFCLLEHFKWPTRKTHKELLLQGYASVRDIPDYKRIMPLLQLRKALAVVGYTIRSKTWNGSNAELYTYNRHFLESF